MTPHTTQPAREAPVADALKSRISAFVANYVSTHNPAWLAAGIADFRPSVTALRLLCGLQVLAEYETLSGVANPVLAQNIEALRTLRAFAAGLRHFAPQAPQMATPYRFLAFAMKMARAIGEHEELATAIPIPLLASPAKPELPAFLVLAAELGAPRALALLQKTSEQFVKENLVDLGIHNWAMSRLALRAGWLWAALYFAVQAGNVGRPNDEAILGAAADDSYLDVEWPSCLPPSSGPNLPLADLPAGAILTDIAASGAIVVYVGRYVLVRPQEWGGDTSRLAQVLRQPAPSAIFDTLQAAREAAKKA